MNITNWHRAWTQWVNFTGVGRFFPSSLAKNFPSRIANVPERHKMVKLILEEDIMPNPG